MSSPLPDLPVPSSPSSFSLLLQSTPSRDRAIEEFLSQLHAEATPQQARGVGSGTPAKNIRTPSHIQHQQERITPMQFRRTRPIESSEEDEDDDEDDVNESDEESTGGIASSRLNLSNPLDESGELDPHELNALIENANWLNSDGVRRVQQQQQHQQRQNVARQSVEEETAEESDPDANPSPSQNVDGGDEDGENLSGLSNAALQSKIASERAVLSDLMTKLQTLQSHASQLKAMSDLSKHAQDEMERMVRVGDQSVAELEKEKVALQKELDALRDNQGDIDDEPSESEIDDQDNLDDDAVDVDGSYDDIDIEDSPVPSDSDNGVDDDDGVVDSPDPVESDSDVEIEIEHSRDQPNESDDELVADQNALKQLEDLMQHLGRTAELQQQRYKNVRRSAANASNTNRLSSDELDEQAADEAEVDERLFYGRQALAEAAAAGRQHQPRSAANGAARATNKYQRRDASSGKVDASGSIPSSHSSPTTLAVPASRVPPVPISRWIGPTALPTSAPGGGSGPHAVYQDRPATAVGTTRGAVRGNTNANNTNINTINPSNSNSLNASWAPPTLSSLSLSNNRGVGVVGRNDRGGIVLLPKKTPSLSSRDSSMIVHPTEESEISPRSRTMTIDGSIVEDEDQDEEQMYRSEEEDDDDDVDDDLDTSLVVDAELDRAAARAKAFAQSYAARAYAESRDHRVGVASSSFEESPLPSDSDSELPYAINASVAAAAAQPSRPKTARQPAPVHLNGRPTGTQRQQQQQKQKQQKRYNDYEQAESIRRPPPSSSRSFDPSSLSSSDLQSVLAYIGTALFTSTIHVGHTGVANSNGGALLGAGRLGASQLQRTRPIATTMPNGNNAGNTKLAKVARPKKKQYGFAPAMPQRAWQ